MQWEWRALVHITNYLIVPDWGKNNYILCLVHAYQGIFYDVYRFLGGEGPSPRRGRDRDDEGGGAGARARSSRDPAG